jgi:hypothetical protein
MRHIGLKLYTLWSLLIIANLRNRLLNTELTLFMSNDGVSGLRTQHQCASSPSNILLILKTAEHRVFALGRIFFCKSL